MEQSEGSLWIRLGVVSLIEAIFGVLEDAELPEAILYDGLSNIKL
jgi:hypothetical protein